MAKNTVVVKVVLGSERQRKVVLAEEARTGIRHCIYPPGCTVSIIPAPEHEKPIGYNKGDFSTGHPPQLAEVYDPPGEFVDD